MSSIYIHIPYCKQACIYCNFHFSTQVKNIKEMVNCIIKELEKRSEYLGNSRLDSIYFGGGTPSIIETKYIYKILNQIEKKFKFNPEIEISLEANPDNLSQKKLSELKDIGINRLSIGVQSFNDKQLKVLNRSHNVKQAFSSVSLARKVGFKNLSIDLIYGLPGQSIKNWEESLKHTIDLNIEHFAAYELTVEKKTALNHLLKNNKLKHLSEKIILKQTEILSKYTMENKYINYEISNFAKNGFFSKHNIGYWKNNNYLGVGPSAHSFNGDSRSWNIASNSKYINNIKNNISFNEVEQLSKHQKYNELIFTNLRTIWGVKSDDIKKRFGLIFLNYFILQIQKWEKSYHVIKNKNTFTLTSKGKLFADRISSDLFIT